MGHVHNRAMRRFLSKIGKSWGEWDELEVSSDEPGAPVGLERSWANDRYTVMHVMKNGFEVLMIRRNDGTSEYPWADLQRIKNEIMGREREAVQVFPRQSEVIDQADMVHLWMVHEDAELPYTFKNFGWGGGAGND